MFENSDRVGVCIKDKESRVIFQNKLCMLHCGDQKNKICQKGCMLGDDRRSPEALKQGIHYKRNIESDIGKIDSVLIEDGETITTLFYDLALKDKIYYNDIQMINNHGFTKSETFILRELLSGATKVEIAKKFFISIATVKTHINNIYKKLPENWKSLKLRRLP